MTYLVLIERRDPALSAAYLIDDPDNLSLIERAAGTELYEVGDLLVSRDLSTFVERFRWEAIEAPKVSFFLVRGSNDYAPTMTFRDIDKAGEALKTEFWELPDGTFVAEVAPGTVGEKFWTGHLATREETMALHGARRPGVSGAA